MKRGDPLPCAKCDGDGEVWHPVEYDDSHFRECDECDGYGVQVDPWSRRCYLALSQEAGAVGWPTSYVEDLTVHDRRYCEQTDPAQPLAWILRDHGTHIVPVKYNPIDGAGNTAWSLIRSCFGEGGWGDKSRFYAWDGRRLIEHENMESLAEWVYKTAHELEHRRKAA